MSEELQQSLERYRAALEWAKETDRPAGFAPVYDEMPVLSKALDATRIANAYLAEHPADEHEPATIEWAAEELGWEHADAVAWINESSRVELWYDGDIRVNGIILKQSATRGDVRRLVQINETAGV